MITRKLKRCLSGLLAALMVLTLLPSAAWAATSLSSAPYANVEYGYSAGVSVGTIRYISQLTSNAYFNWSYWPGSSFGGYASPGSECGTASLSMALSYIGVNKTPYDILNAHNGYTYWDGWGVSMSQPSVATGMNNYVNGNGKYSPVIIHLPNYSSNGHYVVLAGKVSDSVYQVVDPANSSVWNITINGTSAVYSKNGGTIYDTINQVFQYYNPNASLPQPEPEPVIPSGSCGNNLTWRLENGTLTISGSGAMWDWDANNGEKSPWYTYADSIEFVTIGSGVKNIGDYAFWGCDDLTSVTIPYGVTSIGKSAFDGCFALSNVSLPSSVSSIGRWAFAYCTSLSSISIPDSVTSIDWYAFAWCTRLTDIDLPKGIDTLNQHVFCACPALEKVTVPEGVKTIETYAFGVGRYAYGEYDGCENLKEVTLPESLTTIKSYAFDGCPNLEDVYYAGTEAQWNKISIGEYNNSNLLNATIHFAKSDTPTAPKISSAIVTSTGRIKLTWSAVDNAAKYYIYRSTDGGSTYKYYDSTTKTTYTNTSVTPGKTYYYKLKAVGADGTTSKYSNVVYRTADCARPVVKISNVASSGAIKLTWDSVTGASKYYIYRSTDMGETYTYYTSTTSTSWTNKSVTPGKTYYYKVKAICGKSSYGDSAYSIAVSRTADCARPVVKISNVASSGALKLTWDSVTGASKYCVYRSTDGGKTYSYYTSTTSTSWTNKSVTPGKTYYYKVIAVCGKSSYGNSAYSAAVSRSADCARPDVTITRSSSGKPLLKWKAITGAEEYVIYRATSKTGTYTKMFTTTKLSYTNTGAKSGTTYYYKVMAICAKSSYGNSAYSNIVSIKSK